jgi:hypothetical protein
VELLPDMYLHERCRSHERSRAELAVAATFVAFGQAKWVSLARIDTSGSAYSEGSKHKKIGIASRGMLTNTLSDVYHSTSGGSSYHMESF